MIGVSAESQQLLKEVFQRYVPGAEVWVFGSRVSGPVKPSSDLDIALYSTAPISLQTLAILADVLSELPLPFRVDCVDVSSVSPEFRVIIERSRQRLL
jgi:predicted nucleotidyltransferase